MKRVVRVLVQPLGSEESSDDSVEESSSQATGVLASARTCTAKLPRRLRGRFALRVRAGRRAFSLPLSRGPSSL